MTRNSEEYLGDGVYASFDGEYIKLRTRRGAGGEHVPGDHVIYLDPGLYRSLQKFAARLTDEGYGP